jgi:hypothetical protein
VEEEDAGRLLSERDTETNAGGVIGAFIKKGGGGGGCHALGAGRARVVMVGGRDEFGEVGYIDFLVEGRISLDPAVPAAESSSSLSPPLAFFSWRPSRYSLYVRYWYKSTKTLTQLPDVQKRAV